jgi:hypothetical protein
MGEARYKEMRQPGRMGSSPHRDARTGLDGATHHGFGYQMGIVDRGRWGERMAGIIAAVPETGGVHDGRVNIANVDIREFGKLASQRLSQTTQSKFCR